MSPRTRSTIIRCPRCGYDQRGVISTWSECCPLAGTCTECGLDFDWRDILNPTLLRAPSWCVEGARRFRGVVTAIPLTFLRSFWPWSFWGPLRLTHVIRWRRIVAYLVAVMLVVYVGALVCHVGQVRATWRNWGAAYGWSELAMAIALPLSDVAPKPTVMPGGPPGMMRTYPSAREIAHWTWGGRGALIALYLPLHALSAAGFLALPISRRRAKVRWAHVWRILAYGLVLPLPALVGAVAAETFTGSSVAHLTLATFAWLALLAILPLEIAWWSTATGRYLRMPHAWGVGLAVVVMAVLVVALAGSLIVVLSARTWLMRP